MVDITITVANQTTTHTISTEDATRLIGILRTNSGLQWPLDESGTEQPPTDAQVAKHATKFMFKLLREWAVGRLRDKAATDSRRAVADITATET